MILNSRVVRKVASIHNVCHVTKINFRNANPHGKRSLMDCEERIKYHTVRSIARIEGILCAFDPWGVADCSNSEYEGYAIKIWNLSGSWKEYPIQVFRKNNIKEELIMSLAYNLRIKL